MASLTTYLKESREELHKVTWPTKKQTKNYTILVIVISIVVAVAFSLLDIIFEQGVALLARLH